MKPGALDIVIDEHGNVTIEGQGIHDASCLLEIEKLVQALGRRQSSRRKPESCVKVQAPQVKAQR